MNTGTIRVFVGGSVFFFRSCGIFMERTIDEVGNES